MAWSSAARARPTPAAPRPSSPTRGLRRLRAASRTHLRGIGDHFLDVVDDADLAVVDRAMRAVADRAGTEPDIGRCAPGNLEGDRAVGA